MSSSLSTVRRYIPTSLREDYNARVYLAPCFVTSCGVVIFHEDRKKVICISNRSRKRYHFPKGKIEPGETLEAAALREAFEETGFVATLLGDEAGVVRPIAMTVQHLHPNHPQRPKGSPSIQKVVYWFCGTWDGKERVLGTQLSYEDYEVHQLTISDAMQRLTPDAAQILGKAVELAAVAAAPLTSQKEDLVEGMDKLKVAVSNGDAA